MGFFSLLFYFLDEKKIPYAVLRNYEDLPKSPAEGSDVDLLVKRGYKNEYFSAVREIAEKTGGFVLLKSDRKNCLSCFIYQEDSKFKGFWLDAFWEMSSKSFIWGDGDFLLKNRFFEKERGFFKLSKGCEAATLFAKEVFTRGFVKEKYKSRIRDFVSFGREDFIKTLAPYLGEKTSAKMADICAGADWDGSAKEGKEWFLNLALKSFSKRPGGQVIDFLRFIFGYFKKSLPKKGISIVLAGPDGVGKTAVSEELEKSFKNLYFRKIYQYHGHFGFFPEWGKIYRALFGEGSAAKTFPREEKKVSAVRGILSVLYYGLEHILALPWVLWLKLWGNLIIFDRYFYDFAVMNSSSDIPQKLFLVFSRLIHRADIMFILQAPPEIIFERKKELSFKEIKRQDEIFRGKEILKLAPAVLINAKEPLNEVCSAIKKEILKEISKKTT